MQIFLARTQGFCGGVARAIDTVEQALRRYGTPLFVYHEIVHNTAVVQDLRARGVTFVETLEEVPAGARLIFSAHGVSPTVVDEANAKGIHIIDATCPLVSKVHREATRFSEQGIHVVLIGHKGHQEVIGTSGHVAPDRLHMVENLLDIEKLEIPAHQKTGFITQTTLSVDDTRELILKLRAKYPRLTGPDKGSLCYATQNRQDAVRELAGFCSLIIVCGSPSSSNSNRLREKSSKLGIKSIIVDNAMELDMTLLQQHEKIGLTSGASVPRHLIDDIILKIRNSHPDAEVITFDDPETKIAFPLPPL